MSHRNLGFYLDWRLLGNDVSIAIGIKYEDAGRIRF